MSTIRNGQIKKNFKNFMAFFMDEIELSQGYSHFQGTVYFLPTNLTIFLFDKMIKLELVCSL